MPVIQLGKTKIAMHSLEEVRAALAASGIECGISSLRNYLMTGAKRQEYELVKHGKATKVRLVTVRLGSSKQFVTESCFEDFMAGVTKVRQVGPDRKGHGRD